MAATVSAWAKPGAWALDAEAEAAADSTNSSAAATTDFPSLAAATKAPKKKSKTFSLNEFFAQPAPSSEPLVLPTGPRERTAEELERSGGRGGFGGGARWGMGREEPRRMGRPDPEPSRADEIDDWGAGKKTAGGMGMERRERGGGFFGSQSKADESESWTSNKTSPVGRVGVGVGVVGGFKERRVGFESGGGADAESWGRRKEGGEEGSGGARPRLVLQPRTAPLENESVKNQQQEEVRRPKGVNPFGVARPREEVLKEKGQDWKEIDEKLGLLAVRETRPAFSGERAGLVKKSFAGERSEDRADRSWRKAESVEAPATPSSEKGEEGSVDK